MDNVKILELAITNKNSKTIPTTLRINFNESGSVELFKFKKEKTGKVFNLHGDEWIEGKWKWYCTYATVDIAARRLIAIQLANGEPYEIDEFADAINSGVDKIVTALKEK